MLYTGRGTKGAPGACAPRAVKYVCIATEYFVGLSDHILIKPTYYVQAAHNTMQVVDAMQRVNGLYLILLLLFVDR